MLCKAENEFGSWISSKKIVRFVMDFNVLMIIEKMSHLYRKYSNAILDSRVPGQNTSRMLKITAYSFLRPQSLLEYRERGKWIDK